MRMGGLSITRRCEDDPWTPAPDATAGGFFAASANLQLQISSLPLPAPARDFQPDPPVYNLSNRIRFGRLMSAERAFCGMRIDQRGAVAAQIPRSCRVARDCQRTWRGFDAVMCHQRREKAAVG